MAKIKRCKKCEFIESLTSITDNYSSGMKADFCGKLLDEGKTRSEEDVLKWYNCNFPAKWLPKWVKEERSRSSKTIIELNSRLKLIEGLNFPKDGGHPDYYQRAWLAFGYAIGGSTNHDKTAKMLEIITEELVNYEGEGMDFSKIAEEISNL